MNSSSVNTYRLSEASFMECSSLRLVDLPDSVHSVDDSAYVNCTSLQSLTIRSSSHNLRFGNNIVTGCPALSQIKILTSVWPKLFSSMNTNPSFLYKFVREFHSYIMFSSSSLSVITTMVVFDQHIEKKKLKNMIWRLITEDCIHPVYI